MNHSDCPNCKNSISYASDFGIQICPLVKNLSLFVQIAKEVDKTDVWEIFLNAVNVMVKA